MEKIFALMWLADLMGSIGVIGALSAVALTVAAVIVLITFAVTEDGERAPVSVKRTWPVAKWLCLIVAIAVVTPERRTVQLLAVSSAAEAAVTTQLGAKSIEALNAVLDRVINEAKKK